MESDQGACSTSVVERIEQQILADDGDMYQSMNAELDKQIAEDMEAIKHYLNNADESVAKRVEFFNTMDKKKAYCDDTPPVTDHILYQHTALGNIKWHECTQCEFKAQEKSKLMEHLMANHASLVGGELICERCSFRCKVNAELRKHLFQVHNEGEAFTCKECDRNFASQEEVLGHRGEVHDVEVFRCTQCNFVSEDRAGLREHNLAMHMRLNISWYKCAHCSYRTVRKANLDRHIMYKHSMNTILF